MRQFKFTFGFILGWRSILLGGQLCDKGPETSAINHTADNFTGKEGLKRSSKKPVNLYLTRSWLDFNSILIFVQADFLTNHNDQSLVEICITRLTSAIRETRSIERHAEPLVNLLETCLTYNLRPVSGGPDPPHAKIASDVMSCIFLVRV